MITGQQVCCRINQFLVINYFFRGPILGLSVFHDNQVYNVITGVQEMNRDTVDIGCPQHQIEPFLKLFCDYTRSIMPYDYEKTFSSAHYIFMILLLCRQTTQGRQKLVRVFFSTSLARRSISEEKEFFFDMYARFQRDLRIFQKIFW